VSLNNLNNQSAVVKLSWNGTKACTSSPDETLLWRENYRKTR